jgi:hypothetical protein
MIATREIPAGANPAAALERAAPIIAVCAALGVLVVGVMLNTRAAGGSDSYCYISQAEQFAAGRVFLEDRLALDAPWPDAALSITPPGWVPARTRQGAAVPICPPGLSLLMAGVWRVFGVSAIHVVVPVAAALLVWLTYALGRRIGGPSVGAIAAGLLAASPIVLYQVVQPLSDVPAAATWMAVVIAAATERRAGWIACGLAASLALLTRPNLAPLLVPVAILLALPSTGVRTGPGVRVAPLVWFVLALLPGCVILGVLNAARYGSPFSTGYGDLEALFSASHIVPNLQRYPRWLIETQTPFICLALAAPLVVGAHTTPRVRHLVWVSAALAGLVLACYLPYVVFDAWWFIRFMLPALPLILVMSALVASAAVRRFPAWSRTLVVVLGTIGLGVFYVRTANARHAFGLQAFERPYVDAGAYIARTLPADAVVLSSLQAGAVRHHGHRSSVMWWVLPPDGLDGAIAWLQERHRPAYILLEESEEQPFRTRFQGQQAGALDWPPRAVVSGRVKIRLYDPVDRDRIHAGEHIVTTYVPDSLRTPRK